MKTYTTTEIKPADIISGVETLRDATTIQKCYDFEEKNTVSSDTYLEWAQRGYEEGTDYGLSSCISNAKLAVCSKLDKLLILNHLSKILKKTYPHKIDVLEKIGISIPSVVHELIIEPRNDLEHGYALPDQRCARNALGVAKLAISGISDEFGNIVALNWTAIMDIKIAGESPTEFPGWNNKEFPHWGNRTILFVDVFDETPKALLIDEASQEIRFANLDAFSVDEAITFAKMLRSIHQYGKGGPSGVGSSTFRQTSCYRAMLYRNLKTLADL